MITVTQQVGGVAEEHVFDNITDYATYLLLSGSIDHNEFLEFMTTLMKVNIAMGD